MEVSSSKGVLFLKNIYYLLERLYSKEHGQSFDLAEKVDNLVALAASTKYLAEEIEKGLQYSISNITAVINATK